MKSIYILFILYCLSLSYIVQCGELCLGEGGELVFIPDNNSRDREERIQLAQSHHGQVIALSDDPNDECLYMRFTCCTVHEFLTAPRAEASVFSWSPAKGLWKVISDGKHYYLHFHNSKLSYTTIGEWWFFEHGEKIIYGDFKAGDALLIQRDNYLTNPLGTMRLQLISDGCDFTGFRYSKTSKSTVVRRGCDGLPILKVTAPLLTLHLIEPRVFYRNKRSTTLDQGVVSEKTLISDGGFFCAIFALLAMALVIRKFG